MINANEIMNYHSFKNILVNRKIITFLVSSLIFVSISALILESGPYIGGDTRHYTAGADELIKKHKITGRNQNYSGYVAVVALAKLVSSSEEKSFHLIMLIQAAVSFFAMFCVYRLGEELFGKTTAILGAISFSANFYIIFWSKQIHTDSLFISFVIIASLALILSSRNKMWLVAAIPALIFMASLRPNGLFYIPVFLVYLVSLFKAKTRAAIYALLFISALIAATFITGEVQKATDRIQLIDRLEDGTILWAKEFKAMPKMENRSGNVVKDLTSYLVSYPVETLSLMFTRIYRSYFFWRDDYSARHQMALMIALPLIYLFAIAGLARSFMNNIGKDHLLLLGIILAQTFIVAGTFAVHDTRFTCYIFTFIMLFACYGVEWGWQTVTSAISKRGEGA
ncbi:hypothetical protein MNBD_NITROSPINAE02-1795 [hydrothermal vent metagenome]|uniref:Glycosyltransferase RgtA/B/C/D-like domain-containing protein n=1 Tax=hydrothermal vent metagenome TaxID=652676 RepID=A0A3B1BZN1_9ZZZZ